MSQPMAETRDGMEATGTRGGSDGAASETRRSGASLRLERVSKTYGDVEALRDVSLEVRPGEFLSLLGPSGSGKTTAMMAVAGFTDVTSGDIYVDGRSIVGQPAHRRDIGLVFQSYALFPHMTVEQNVAYPLRARHRPRREIGERTARALDLVQLGGYGKRRIGQLSGGQQQRVALARAFVFDPPLLLMDEPLSALDKNLRETMRYELKRLQRALNVTVVYVTHDQSEALVMSDRVAVIDRGVLQQVGPPHDIYNRPQTEFVASFVGDSNLLAVEVLGTAADGSATVRSTGGLQFEVTGNSGAVAGTQAQVLLRPERIKLLAEGDPYHATFSRRHDGVVEEVGFLGDSTRYVVRVAGERLVARVPNDALAFPARPADRVQVGWSAADAALVR